eukprot:4328651-Prymnesium_polylepis.1
MVSVWDRFRFWRLCGFSRGRTRSAVSNISGGEARRPRSDNSLGYTHRFDLDLLGLLKELLVKGPHGRAVVLAVVRVNPDRAHATH